MASCFVSQAAGERQSEHAPPNVRQRHDSSVCDSSVCSTRSTVCQQQEGYDNDKTTMTRTTNNTLFVLHTLMLPPALKNSHFASIWHSSPSSCAMCLMRIMGVSPTFSSAFSRILPRFVRPALNPPRKDRIEQDKEKRNNKRATKKEASAGRQYLGYIDELVRVGTPPERRAPPSTPA